MVRSLKRDCRIKHHRKRSKAHSKSIGIMENSTPCTIVTPENFILKLGIRDYVETVCLIYGSVSHYISTHYTNFHVHRFSGGFSTNR